MSGQPVTLAAREPRIRSRMRVSHDKLAKEGWRFDTSAEVEFGDDVTIEDAERHLAQLVEVAGTIGQAERGRRNADDGFDPNGNGGKP